MGGHWKAEALINQDHPPITHSEGACPECGGRIVFRQYWTKVTGSSTGGHYMTPAGTCRGECKRKYTRSLKTGEVRASQRRRSCHRCGSLHLRNSGICKTCADGMEQERRNKERTIACQHRDCAVEFIAKAWERNRKYCSPRCGNLENKARRRDMYKEGRVTPRKASFRRDSAVALAFRHGYLCALCGEMIDVSLGPTDRMGLTIDHIVPLAQGGTEDEGNLQPAHRSCNSAKGAR